MHIWVIEVKDDKDSDWRGESSYCSRSIARLNLYWFSGLYNARVVKYISTKGE